MASSGVDADTDGGVAAKSLTLPAAAASVRVARGFVQDQLTRDGMLDDTVETAVLLVSELVTNAVLHASSAIEIRVSLSRSARIDVRDASNVAPVRRRHTAESVTGRGLELVEMLATSYGVDHTPDGKSVWFTIGGSPDAGDSAWHSQVSAPAVIAELCGVPRVLYEVMNEHQEALLREYALSRLGDSGQDGPTGRDVRAADRAQAAIAAAPGWTGSPTAAEADHVDVRVQFSAEDAAALPVLRAVLDGAERLAADGVLLTRPALPELRAVRDWCLDQLQQQVAGGVPRPWPRPTYVDDDDDRSRALTSSIDVGWVTREARAVIVGDEDNRIVAVSPAAAELLGWAPDELAGRRIVTIIPTRFREAHVAGFTRQLVTGRSRILDQPAALPARHRDGHDIPAIVTLQRRRTGQQSYFLAWISPTGE